MEHNQPIYDILELAKKWQEGTINAAEKAYYEQWYNSFDDTRLELHNAKNEEELSNRIYEKLKAKIDAGQDKRRPLFYRIAVAASVILCLSLGLYYYQKNNSTEQVKSAFANDVKPGGNKAFLTLANGRRMLLTDTVNGKLAEEAGVRVTKTADGALLYTITGPATSAQLKTAYHTIETPKGGRYQISLPDGSRVWLNAGSKLVYPVSFNHPEGRKVILSGEAYFEVARDPSRPFRVKSSGQEILVLGTHFNINTYPEESYSTTTLLEGSVRINGENGDHALLKPGQQSFLDKTGIKISQVDTEEAVAWKNGFFYFENADIETVMRQISRWYDVEIVYHKKVNTRFYAQIPSKSNLSEVLKALELTGKVHFEIQGRKVIINP